MKYAFINHSFNIFFLAMSCSIRKRKTLSDLTKFNKTKKGDSWNRGWNKIKDLISLRKKTYLLHWLQSSQRSTRAEQLDIHCIGLTLKHSYFQHYSMCRMLDLLLSEWQNLACESFKNILNIKCKKIKFNVWLPIRTTWKQLKHK